MAGRVEHLEVLIPAPDGRVGEDLGDVTQHPMRLVTEQVAGDESSWSTDQARRVAGFFDALADGWDERTRGDRHDPLLDACARGGVPAASWCLELGSGTGQVTPVLAERFGSVLCVDLAAEMLRRAPTHVGWRVQADGARLPLADATVEVAVLVNALLFPAELARVLAPGGVFVWVNSRGPGTPIHLAADEVVAALPGAWRGVASAAGAGTWLVARRD